MQAWASKVRAGKGSKGDRLGIVDHATINYPPFRKNFYIEVGCPLCLSYRGSWHACWPHV